MPPSAPDPAQHRHQPAGPHLATAIRLHFALRTVNMLLQRLSRECYYLDAQHLAMGCQAWLVSHDRQTQSDA